VEATLVVMLYLFYDASRGLAAGGSAEALSHARDIASVERMLHIVMERQVQRAVVAVPHLIGMFNTGYDVLHLAVPALLLVGLWRRRPERFALVRNALLVTSGLALVGFIVFPTAPPRMAGLGIADTVSQGHANMNSGLLEHFYNPYAAFPSLHIGYAVVSGVAIWALARRWPLRVLGLLYPAFVAVEVIATGNHFLIDILAGAAVSGAGLVAASGLQRLAVAPQPIVTLPSRRALPLPRRSPSGLSTPGRQPHPGEPVTIWRAGRRVLRISATRPLPGHRRGHREGMGPPGPTEPAVPSCWPPPQRGRSSGPSRGTGVESRSRWAVRASPPASRPT
jgi:membrane-associated phospholipid phosphatase